METMTVAKRLEVFNNLARNLMSTSSRNDKELCVAIFKRENPEMIDDLNYIFETLSGQHPIGWTFNARVEIQNIVERMNKLDKLNKSYKSIKQLIESCINLPNKSILTTMTKEKEIDVLGYYFEPIVNRTLKLGIGKSLLDKKNTAPMLAKKYEGGTLFNKVCVTEKLDGNRCIAYYDFDLDSWLFVSRSGKALEVNFDMTGMNPEYIYDGEIMSVAQTDLSVRRHQAITNMTEFSFSTGQSQFLFNATSGLINRKGYKTGLVYNIFDIIENEPYINRREKLENLQIVSDDIRILPVIYMGGDTVKIDAFLDSILRMGGEGLMLNKLCRTYENKRTDALLKYKKVKTMDMVVTNITEGSGKYEGCVGALVCTITTDDNKNIFCEVGTGLSDSQRIKWYEKPESIIGKIVTIGYHELTQSEALRGSNAYSLRFPRLITVRTDKTESSEY